MFLGGPFTSSDGDCVITCVSVDSRLVPVRTDHPRRRRPGVAVRPTFGIYEKYSWVDTPRSRAVVGVWRSDSDGLMSFVRQWLISEWPPARRWPNRGQTVCDELGSGSWDRALMR
ncbi:Hypothetical protein CINCED_3A016922 [Cinara cedri]|uniref:Uncharacterized protein n=1 Tax=Cinara cedri TaxID=506608 RepID=A0A5E4NFW2_9HEMI|nr:Hypothetical protein CINCED_3A016922 [Cinara cedri]